MSEESDDVSDDGKNEAAHLAHTQGDAVNAVFAAAGYNFRLLLTRLRLLLRLMLATMFGPVGPLQA